MTRGRSRTALVGAVLATLGIVSGCQGSAPGNLATIRFGLDATGSPVAAGVSQAAAADPVFPAAPAPAPAFGFAAEVLPPPAGVVLPGRVPASVTARGGSGGGSSSPSAMAPRNETRHPANGPGRASVRIDLGQLAGANQRRLLATVADIAYVEITVTPSQGEEVSQIIAASDLAGGVGTASFTGLPAVPSTVTIKAYDAGGVEIGKDSQQITVSPTVPTVIAFTVTLYPTYVTNTGQVDAGITIVDGPVIIGTPPPGVIVPTGTVVAAFKSLAGPETVAFDAAGTPWVPFFGADRVASFDARLGLKLSLPLSLPAFPTARLNPTKLAFAPDGGMWIANYAASTVMKVDQTTGLPTRVIAVGPNPADIGFDATGNLLVVSHPLDSIFKFSQAGAKLATYYSHVPAFPVPSPGTHLPLTLKVGAAGDMWVVNLKSDSVMHLSAAGLPIAPVVVGDEPEGLVLDTAGNPWVTNNKAGTLMKIEAATHKVVETYPVGKRPRGLAFDKAGNLWVACSEDDQVVRISPKGVILGRYRTGDDPRGVAVDASGAIWISCFNGNVVQKLAP